MKFRHAITIRKAVIAAAVGGAAAVSLLTAVPAEAASSQHGCPLGYACLYPAGAGWNNDRPYMKFYTYKTTNLSSGFGTQRFFNNQTNHAAAYMCTGNWGGGSCYGQPTGTYGDWNMDPIYSIKIEKSGG